MFKQIALALGDAVQPRGHAGAPAKSRNHRERVPVRRGSRLRGQCEAGFWEPTNRQEVNRVLLAAELYDKEERQRGRRNGPLGHVGLEVLKYLTRVVSFETGRLEPSYSTLTDRLNRSRDAVSKALAALQRHGFLHKLRRVEATGQEGQRGPQVRQASNAYRLSLPERGARLLGHMGKAAPPPDDFEQMRADRAAEREAHRAALGLDELPRFEVEDDILAKALSVMGRLLQERESAKQGESLTKRIF